MYNVKLISNIQEVFDLVVLTCSTGDKCSGLIKLSCLCVLNGYNYVLNETKSIDLRRGCKVKCTWKLYFRDMHAGENSCETV